MTDRGHENRYRVPESFTIMGVDSEDKSRLFRGKFEKKELSSREDLLKNLNAAVRMIARRYSQPIKYTYKTNLLFEVKAGERVERMSGEGRYEVYHWNK